MPPKKNVKTSSVKEGKASLAKPRGRPKTKNKPVKVPNIMTVSIRNQRGSLDVPDYQRKVDGGTKLALADEVVRSQLLMEPVEERMVPPKKKGRKKNVVSNFFCNTDVGCTKGEAAIRKSDCIKTAKTVPGKHSPLVTRAVTRKRVADSTEQQPKIKQRKVTLKNVSYDIASEAKAIEQKIGPNIDCQNVIKNEASTADTTTKTSAKSKTNKTDNQSNQPTASRPVKRTRLNLVRKNKGKQDAGTFQNTPETLELPINPPTAVKSLKKELDIKAKKLESQRSSLSSVSNFSWTRDISSTTTCITVSSNDFIRFDEKLPIMILNNVDSEVDKYKRKFVEEDDSSSSSDSSSDSETSTEQNSVDKSSLAYPVNSNCLNLSTSSLISVQPELNSDINKQDYGQATENLKQVVKKMDMELINWIYETEITSDLNKIKDELLGILYSELSVLKHCRNLKKCCNPDLIDDSNVYVAEETANTNTHDSQEVKHNTINLLESKRREIDNNNIELNKESNLVSRNKLETLSNYNRSVVKNVVDKVYETPKVINSIAASELIENTPVAVRLVKNNSPVTKKTETKELENNEIDVTDEKRLQTKQIVTNRVETSTDINDATEKSVGPTSTDEIRSNLPDDSFMQPSTSRMAAHKDSRDPTYDSKSGHSFSEAGSDYKYDILNTNYDVQDDDDALSLFAESITGIESSRVNISVISPPPPAKKECEEYIPKPVQVNSVPLPTYSYQPTRIMAEPVKNVVTKTVCEKQNADSTSISKEAATPTPIDLPSSSLNTNHSLNETPVPNVNAIGRQHLISNIYPFIRKHDTYKTIFAGHCSFNITGQCINWPCRYPHTIPTKPQMKNQLARISQDFLITGYILIRRNKHLMSAYGMYFLEEVANRRLTRVVVEIAHDFIVQGEYKHYLSKELVLEAVGAALLYLNNVDLRVCEDLLMMKLSEEGTFLCEAFLSAMTTTHNFSQFKQVFLSLTYIMVQKNLQFNIDVVEQILERICILPFDEPVVKALIQMMRLTNPYIFLNPMIQGFETLIISHKHIWDEYMLVKSGINFENLVRCAAEQSFARKLEEQLYKPVEQPMFVQSLGAIMRSEAQQGPARLLLQQPVAQIGMQPLLQQPLGKPVGHHLLIQTDQCQSVRPQQVVPLPPSPDTTHLDKTVKSAEEIAVPKFTRTIWGYSPKDRKSQSPNVSFIGSLRAQSAGVSFNGNPMNQPQGMSFGGGPESQAASVGSCSSKGDEAVHMKWQHRSIFHKIARGNLSALRPLRARPPRGRGQRLFNRTVTLGGSVAAYPPPGPDG